MVLYRANTLTVVSGGAAQNLNLGFTPDIFRMRNDTILSSGTLTGVVEVYWDRYMGSLATPRTSITTMTTGVAAYSSIDSAALGVVPFQTSDSLLYVPAQAPYNDGTRTPMGASTLLKVTGISKATNAVITSTAHSLTSADVGVTWVTFHYVTGMTQINTLSAVVMSIVDANNFSVNINSTNFSTFTNDGKAQANVITGAPVSTLYGNQILNTSEANLGVIGLTLGTTIMAVTGNVWFYEAILQSPVTGP